MKSASVGGKMRSIGACTTEGSVLIEAESPRVPSKPGRDVDPLRLTWVQQAGALHGSHKQPDSSVEYKAKLLDKMAEESSSPDHTEKRTQEKPTDSSIIIEKVTTNMKSQSDNNNVDNIEQNKVDEVTTALKSLQLGGQDITEVLQKVFRRLTVRKDATDKEEGETGARLVSRGPPGVISAFGFHEDHTKSFLPDEVTYTNLDFLNLIGEEVKFSAGIKRGREEMTLTGIKGLRVEPQGYPPEHNKTVEADLNYYELDNDLREFLMENFGMKDQRVPTDFTTNPGTLPPGSERDELVNMWSDERRWHANDSASVDTDGVPSPPSEGLLHAASSPGSSQPWSPQGAPSPGSSQALSTQMVSPRSPASSHTWSPQPQASPASSNTWSPQRVPSPTSSQALSPQTVPSPGSSQTWSQQTVPSPASSQTWSQQTVPSPASSQTWSQQTAPSPGSSQTWSQQTAPSPGSSQTWSQQTVPSPGSSHMWSQQTAPSPGSSQTWSQQTAPSPGSSQTWSQQTAPSPGSSQTWSQQTVPSPGSSQTLSPQTVPSPGSSQTLSPQTAPSSGSPQSWSTGHLATSDNSVVPGCSDVEDINIYQQTLDFLGHLGEDSSKEQLLALWKGIDRAQTANVLQGPSQPSTLGQPMVLQQPGQVPVPAQPMVLQQPGQVPVPAQPMMHQVPSQPSTLGQPIMHQVPSQPSTLGQPIMPQVTSQPSTLGQPIMPQLTSQPSTVGQPIMPQLTSQPSTVCQPIMPQLTSQPSTVGQPIMPQLTSQPSTVGQLIMPQLTIQQQTVSQPVMSQVTSPPSRLGQPVRSHQRIRPRVSNLPCHRVVPATTKNCGCEATNCDHVIIAPKPNPVTAIPTNIPARQMAEVKPFTITPNDRTVALNKVIGVDKQEMLVARRKVASLPVATLMKKDPDGDTLQHMVVVKRHMPLLVALLERHEREGTLLEIINERNNLNQTCVHIAVILQHQQMVRLLLNHGADPSLAAFSQSESNPQERHHTTALHLAAKMGDSSLPILQALLDCKKTKLNQSCSNGLSALHYAAKCHGQTLWSMDGKQGGHKINCMKTLQALVHAGADIGQKDGKSGKTPLHFVLETCDVSFIQHVLDTLSHTQVGEALSHATYDGNTALHIAVGLAMKSEDHKMLIRMLMLKGADATRRNWNKQKAADLIKNQEIINILKQTNSKMANLSAMPHTTTNGATILMPAPMTPQLGMVSNQTMLFVTTANQMPVLKPAEFQGCRAVLGQKFYFP